MTHGNPYGQHQEPPPPYGQHYRPQSGYGPPPPQNASTGLAITALVFGVVAAVLTFTAIRLAAPVAGLIAAVLAGIALAAKSQGGKGFATAGLTLGLASLPLTLIFIGVVKANERANDDRLRQSQACIVGKTPEEALKCF